MDKKLILARFFTKKGKDYTYTIAFFLIFSFFTFFVIRPNLLEIYKANLKIQNLKKLNAYYENQIKNVINAQSILVEVRDDLGLIDEAITKKPQVNELIRDINNTVNQDGLILSKTNLVDLYLKDVSRTEELKTIILKVGINGGFDNYLKMLKNLYKQRRLKLLRAIDINKNTAGSTASGELKIDFQLEGYYL